MIARLRAGLESDAPHCLGTASALEQGAAVLARLGKSAAVLASIFNVAPCDIVPPIRPARISDSVNVASTLPPSISYVMRNRQSRAQSPSARSSSVPWPNSPRC